MLKHTLTHTYIQTHTCFQISCCVQHQLLFSPVYSLLGLHFSGPVLLVARGTTARPTFQSIPLSQQHLQQQQQGAGKSDSSNGGATAVFLLQATTGGVLLESTAAAAGGGVNGMGLAELKGSKAGKAQHSRQDVTVLGPENQVCALRICRF